MKTLLVSEFKAHCVGVLNEVADFGEEVIVTKRGKPLARILPIQAPLAGDRIAGDYASKGTILVDLLAEDSGEWEALQE